MRKKKGMTLKEQIDKQLQKVKKYDVVKHIDDSFFSQCEENGCLFQLRRTNLQREGGRTLNIPDEYEIAAEEQRREEEEKAKHDITFEEYKAQFEEHIEGRADARSQHDSEVDDAEPKASVGKEKKSNRGKTEQNKTSSNFNNEEGEEEGKSQRSQNQSKRSKSINKSTVDARSASKVDQSFKYDVPVS